MNEDFNNEETRTEPERAYTPVPPEIPVKEKKGMSAKGIVALALCCALLGGVVGGVGTSYFFRNGSAEAPEEPDTVIAEVTPEPEKAPEATPEVVEQATPQPAAAMTAADVYEANVNSTVGITTSITTNYWGYQSTSAASGSGFIITGDGYILTNYHVIEDSDSVTVTTYDNKSYVAEIVGYDISNDIAVLKIDAQDLRPVTLGSSGSLRVGDTVIAIGNPLGELTFSLTLGVVSALNREVTLESGTAMDLIQTDTAINSGNSGGALFNMQGEVIGITNAKYSSSGSSTSASIDNIGFAIPIDHVRGIVESIIQYGYIVKPYIGVSVATVSAEMQSYNFPQGAAVKAIAEGSPAENCGLKINDIITAVDGETITTSSDLVRIVSASSPGATLKLSVFRQNEGDITIDLVVGEKRQDAKEEPERTEQSYSYPYGGNNGGNDGWGNFPFGFGW
jgi:serine protease Do